MCLSVKVSAIKLFNVYQYLIYSILSLSSCLLLFSHYCIITYIRTHTINDVSLCLSLSFFIFSVLTVLSFVKRLIYASAVTVCDMKKYK